VRSQVFISHSTSEADAPLVGALEAACNAVGLVPYLAGREFAPSSVADKLRAALVASDYLMAVLTPASVVSPWVNQELAMARELEKPIIPLLEQGTPAPGFISGRDQIRFSREDFGAAVKRAVEYILKTKAATDPIFRIQMSVLEGGQEIPVTLSVLEAVHVHRVVHQLSREEVLAFLDGKVPCIEPDAEFYLRATYETSGGRSVIWLKVPDLTSPGWKVGDDLFLWPRVLQSAPESPLDELVVSLSEMARGTAPTDRADSGLPRIVLKTTRDLADLHGRRIPAGTEGLFVWLPETTPWGEETVQVRMGDKTEVLPLDAVVAVGPPGQAELWNRTRDKILAS
jgi:hypothetical protein